LYHVGKSPQPLLVSEVEKNIVKDGSTSDNEKTSCKYVYEVEKIYFPISTSSLTPSKILFTSNDFLKQSSYDSKEHHVEIDNEFKDKLRRRIYVNYQSCFYYIDKDNVRHHIDENDLEVVYQKTLDENNIPVIELIISNKKASIINKKPNYIKILINNIGSITKDLIDRDTFNVRFYFKTISLDNEKKIDVYSDIKKDTSRKKQSETKTLGIKKLSLSTYNSKPTYIDASDEHIPRKPRHVYKRPRPRPRLKYILNLRGLLHFISLCNSKDTEDIEKINEVIENICNQDIDIDLQEEVDMKCYGFKVEQFREGEKVEEKKGNLQPLKPLYKAKIKNRFPLLSFYNDYKNSLPSNFMVDFLFGIVIQLNDTLENKRIYDLKYEVTEKYLKHIRNSLHNPLRPKIRYLAMEKKEYNALKTFENATSLYIDRVKETTREIERDNERFLKNQDTKVQFERKLYNLVSSNKPVISIKPILPRDNRGIIFLTSIERSVIEKFCKYTRDENESYNPICGQLLIKNKLLKEIHKNITKSNFDKDLKSELKKNKIPDDCLLSIKTWIRDYEYTLVSEKFSRWIKMVNQYPKFQTYKTSFLFEYSVFNSCFCNRLFSFSFKLEKNISLKETK